MYATRAKLRILLVDDDELILRGLTRMLRSRYDIRVATTVVEGLREVARSQPDLILCDYDMPPLTGADLLRAVSDGYPHIRRLVLSGQPEAKLRPLVDSGLAHRVLEKPCPVALLLTVLEEEAEEHSALQQ